MIDKKIALALLVLILLGSLNFENIRWKVQLINLQNLESHEYVLGEEEASLEFLKEHGYDCSISKTMEFTQQKRRGKSIVCMQGGTSLASVVMCSPTEPDTQQMVIVLGKKVVEYSLRLECKSG